MKIQRMRRAGLVGLLIAAAGCDADVAAPGSQGVASVAVAPDTLTLEIGATRAVAAVLRAGNGTAITGRPIAWASENDAVASISAAGVVTATGAGTTRITATAGGRVGHATITVAQLPLASLEIAGDSVIVLERGQSVNLLAFGRDATGRLLNGVIPEWSTSDEEKVWVSDTGGIVARRGGATTITATFSGKTASVRVRVPAVQRVDVLPGSNNVSLGGVVHARADVHTEAGVRAVPVQWASENPDVAVVNAHGIIVPIRPGTAIIRASAEGVAGRTLLVVNGVRAPMLAAQVNGGALPVTLHATSWTDAQGIVQHGQLVLVAAQLRIDDDRYEQRSFVHYLQNGEFREAAEIVDSGAAHFGMVAGHRILVSDRYPGRESHGSYEYANGFPTGRITLTQRIGHEGDAVTVLYRP